jgi:amino acid transporter
MTGATSQLTRPLGRSDVLSLAFGATIGWSWVVLTGSWLTDAGALGAILAFATGGFAMIFVALVYAELAAALPEAGSEHVYSMRALGPAGAFVCSWAIVLGYVAVAAFETVALPYAVAALSPGINRGALWTLQGFDVTAGFVAVGLAGAAVIVGVNIRGAAAASALQKTVTAVILGVGVFFLAGATGTGSVANLAPLFSDGCDGVATVLIMVPIMFVGFDVIPQATAEIALPPRAIGRLIVISVGCAVAWYCAIIAGVAWVLPAAAREADGMTTVLACATAWGGEWAGAVLLVGGIAGIPTTWNALVVGASRLVQVLAAASQLPALLARVHPRYGTPHMALALIGALTCLAPWFGRPVVLWLINAGSFAVIIGYALVALSFRALRRREPGLPRPYRVAHGALVGVLALLLSLGLSALYLPGSPAALSAPEWSICITWTVLDAASWMYTRPTAHVGGSHVVTAGRDRIR